MVTLPPDLVATKFPGYFWHTTELVLYSLKPSGVLRQMQVTKPNYFNRMFSGYRVSVNGSSWHLSLDYLSALKMKDSVIPYEKPKMVIK